MLISALYVSGSGTQAASGFLDTVGNNVANATTTGFKTVQTSFQDLLYQGLLPGANVKGETPPGSTQLGLGTTISANTGLFTQGPLTPSTGPIDLAITGQGFFQVTLPNGTTAYTRAGNFSINSAGHIVTSEGFLLAGGITVPTGTSAVSVSPAGVVSATTPTGVQQIGQIQIAQFRDPGSLARVGDTTFVASPASSTPITGAPGTGPLGTLTQGFLEQSNVNLPNELVNLIVAQQAFAFNSQAINVENETLAGTASLLIQ
jgi:flagellar basal-body rod protein FlgG